VRSFSSSLTRTPVVPLCRCCACERLCHWRSVCLRCSLSTTLFVFDS
jgi:hypothetical protein